MALHDWTDRPGWEGMHHLWIAELLRWVKPRLPAGYRAYIGSAPLLAVGAPSGHPDLNVRQWERENAEAPEAIVTGEANGESIEPDEEVAVATIDPETSVFVERQGRLIAAIEVISPRNKDRPIARSSYLTRYLGYLLDGANLVLVDVHRRPHGFSFADSIATTLTFSQPQLATPMAISYRVGESSASGGRLLAIWRRPLTVDAPLPTIPLPLSVELSVPLDLNHTYARAADDAYLSP